MTFPTAAKNFAVAASGRCSEISSIAYALHYKGSLTQEEQRLLIDGARSAIGDLFWHFANLETEFYKGITTPHPQPQQPSL